MEVLDTLGVSPVVALIQIVIFIGFYFIVKQFLFTPIMKIVNSRENFINSKNKEIEDLSKKIEEFEQKINTMLAESDKDVLKVEEEKLKEVLHRKAEIVAKMHEELLTGISKLKENFESEKTKMIDELEKILEPIKENILSKLTNKN